MDDKEDTQHNYCPNCGFPTEQRVCAPFCPNCGYKGVCGESDA